MPVRKPGTEKLDTQRPAVTSETLSASAAQAALTPIDEKTALMIRVCDADARADYEAKLGAVKVQLTALGAAQSFAS